VSKILVTGGAGFIGSNFVRMLLLGSDHELVNVDALTYAGNLENLTDVEKHQVQVLFATFSRLTPDQRAKCLEAFNQFANMTPAERSHFLSNAARWKAMSPEEQRVWRTLTGQLPPAPPGFPSLAPSPPTPPMPQKPDGAVGTNRQAGL